VSDLDKAKFKTDIED